MARSPSTPHRSRSRPLSTCVRVADSPLGSSGVVAARPIPVLLLLAPSGSGGLRAPGQGECSAEQDPESITLTPIGQPLQGGHDTHRSDFR
jgi:hypothetical protein